jgi:2-phospho-L-lactate guanylyltransferase
LLVTPPTERASFVVLAKDIDNAKTRLTDDRALAAAITLEMAKRTVSTALDAACALSVFVVTSDSRVAQAAVGLGAVVVPEGRPLGINSAAALGRRRALRSNPDVPVSILVADLPQLRATELDAVIAEHAERRTPLYVEDHLGEGTTCLVHGPREQVGIAFGRDSARMHRRLGYSAALRPMSGLRLDLDTEEDLRAFGRDLAAAGPMT